MLAAPLLAATVFMPVANRSSSRIYKSALSWSLAITTASSGGLPHGLHSQAMISAISPSDIENIMARSGPLWHLDFLCKAHRPPRIFSIVSPARVGLPTLFTAPGRDESVGRFFQVAVADVFIIVIEKTSDEIKICPARISLCRVSSLSACTSSAGSFLL